MDLALLDRLAVDWEAVGSARRSRLRDGADRDLAGGARVEIDGSDLSPGMLAAARARGVYRSLHEAEVADTGLAPAAYDLVVSCLVDEHLADLWPLYAEAARLVAPGGLLALVGFHPHFIIASGMPTHFDDAEAGEPLAIETYVHLLSDQVAAGLGAGLCSPPSTSGLSTTSSSRSSRSGSASAATRSPSPFSGRGPVARDPL